MKHLVRRAACLMAGSLVQAAMCHHHQRHRCSRSPTTASTPNRHSTVMGISRSSMDSYSAPKNSSFSGPICCCVVLRRVKGVERDVHCIQHSTTTNTFAAQPQYSVPQAVLLQLLVQALVPLGYHRCVLPVQRRQEDRAVQSTSL